MKITTHLTIFEQKNKMISFTHQIAFHLHCLQLHRHHQLHSLNIVVVDPNAIHIQHPEHSLGL